MPLYCTFAAHKRRTIKVGDIEARRGNRSKKIVEKFPSRRGASFQLRRRVREYMQFGNAEVFSGGARTRCSKTVSTLLYKSVEIPSIFFSFCSFSGIKLASTVFIIVSLGAVATLPLF